ncbi:hypothetical protein GK047_20415 [Paenibacillus sp. SYP-B3998]|uniref:Uncharacterized protein n=1 Tax=Paenibacillus sp. SYP-B3998 TaxID=2678564 RepID=A0A6G4A1J9_9BACL|nr:hypothetical protein [Paenibacillus sp. SYP-B3998]NEW08366.1 hypothetical protein [Paenibacillus sp. SYP-B3998]
MGKTKLNSYSYDIFRNIVSQQENLRPGSLGTGSDWICCVYDCDQDEQITDSIKRADKKMVSTKDEMKEEPM